MKKKHGRTTLIMLAVAVVCVIALFDHGGKPASPKPVSVVVTHSAQPTPRVTRTTAAPAPAPSTAPVATQGCALDDEGNCYKSGEFCRAADHNETGTDAYGLTITCESTSDGWKWES